MLSTSLELRVWFFSSCWHEGKSLTSYCKCCHNIRGIGMKISDEGIKNSWSAVCWSWLHISLMILRLDHRCTQSTLMQTSLLNACQVVLRNQLVNTNYRIILVCGCGVVERVLLGWGPCCTIWNLLMHLVRASVAKNPCPFECHVFCWFQCSEFHHPKLYLWHNHVYLNGSLMLRSILVITSSGVRNPVT